MEQTRVLRFGALASVVNVFGVYLIAVFFLLLGVVLQATGVIQNFISWSNFLNIIDNVSLLGIVVVGMAFVTYSGNYADLSVPTTMALTGIVAVEMLRYGFFPAILAAILVGLLIGLINALVVGKLKANPIIWTLAVNYVTLGIIRLVWANKQIYPETITDNKAAISLFDGIFRHELASDLFGNELLDIRLPTILMLILMIVGQFILTRTTFGAQLKMTGSAKKAARFSGINVDVVVGMAFVLAAITATIGGLTVTSLSRVGAYYNGTGYDFRAVTAIVIGGMTLAGGRGSIIGVMGGVLVIGFINNIMTLLGVPTLSQDMIRGLIFIIVVGISAKSLRSLGRDDS
jgi:ribose/xylose/arabinose/galactoside ABC-type transport system permease subunit